jgi:hypothetical protein
MSLRMASAAGAVLLAGALGWRMIAQPSRESAAPRATPALAPAGSAGLAAPQTPPPPEPTPLPASPQRAQTRPETGLWARLTARVKNFFTPSSADADGDGRLSTREREDARERVQQRRQQRESAP